MSTDNEHIPTVRFSMTDSWSSTINQLMHTMAKVSSGQGVTRLQRLQYALDTNAKKVIHNAGVDVQKKAREIERVNVGGKKSGYKPTGNLMRSIDAHDNSEGMQTEIAPEAMTKQDYEYGQAVEFGTKDGRMPAQPFMKPAGDEIGSKLNDAVREALKQAIKEA